MKKRLKYQAFIDKAVSEGASLPQMIVPENKLSYRFVFSDNSEKNHIPVCIMNPKRILPKDVMTSGYALSCFGNEAQAKNKYTALKQNFKMIAKSIGDALAEGTITNNDGLITCESEESSHFDFYEFERCNPSEMFNVKFQFV